VFPIVMEKRMKPFGCLFDGVVMDGSVNEVVNEVRQC
jgi:hypothetical protein